MKAGGERLPLERINKLGRVCIVLKMSKIAQAKCELIMKYVADTHQELIGSCLVHGCESVIKILQISSLTCEKKKQKNKKHATY